MTRFGVCLATALACLFSTQITAQIISGSIGGTVTDATAAVIANVKVTVSGPALIGGSRTLISDDKGSYRFLELPLGTYTVTFEKPGFKTSSVQGIEINSGVQVTTNVRLDLGNVSEQVTVRAEATTIDLEHVTQTSVANQAVMENLPNGRSPWAIANAVAGVVTAVYDVGGSGGMQQSGLTAHGSNVADQKFMIDGVSVNWPGGGGGSTLMYYDM